MIQPSDFYHLLSDETRLRCLMLLIAEQELCVCELNMTLECSQPKISRHLSMLRSSGVVSDERRGQWIYYRIHSALPEWMHKLLTMSAQSLQEIEPYQSDLNRLRSQRKRKNACSTPTKS